MTLSWKKVNTTTFQADHGPDTYEAVYQPKMRMWGAFKSRWQWFFANEDLRLVKERCELEVVRQEFYSRDAAREENRRKRKQIYVAIGVRIFYNGEIESKTPLDRTRVSPETRILLDEILSQAKEISMATVTSSKAAVPAAGPVADAKAPKEKKAPPRSPGSATDEEVDAAVAGTLKPRAEKGTAEQEALTAQDEKGRPKGRPLGLLTGMPILMTWCLAFQENQKSPGQVHASVKGLLGRKPDDAITAFMKANFPDRTTPAFDHPQGCRNDYNNGVFTKNRNPATMSSPFNEKGEQIEPTRRARKEADAAAAPAAAPVAKPAVAKAPAAAVAAPTAKPKIAVKKAAVTA